MMDKSIILRWHCSIPRIDGFGSSGGSSRSTLSLLCPRKFGTTPFFDPYGYLLDSISDESKEDVLIRCSQITS
jgi:hypothetical protein